MTESFQGIIPTSARTGSAEDEPTVHHVSSRKKRGVTSASMSINLGPMIDVIFNLLIYFVVTANFALDEGILTLKLPQGSGTPAESLAPPQTPLNITLRSDAPIGVTIRLQTQDLGSSFEDLGDRLRQLQFDPQNNPAGVYKPDNPVIIQPEGLVRWQHVVNAFNAAVGAKYSNVSFAQVQQDE